MGSAMREPRGKASREILGGEVKALGFAGCTLI